MVFDHPTDEQVDAYEEMLREEEALRAADPLELEDDHYDARPTARAAAFAPWPPEGAEYPAEGGRVVSR